MADLGDPVERIAAPNDLRARAPVLSGRAADDPVARAEAALKILSRQFDGWIAAEVDEIGTRWRAFADAGLSAGAERDAFYRSVHDLKGQAATLGFPLAARVAASLCRLLERTEDGDPPPTDLLESHVAAIRAIVREGAREEDDPVGHRLADALVRLADDAVGDAGIDPGSMD